ncbi:ABC transporter substrate-binding protein [Cumulibacter manganitolerans]|uniref:ABC transporter substrate-binding protein n=1 Tax=Cumulibacter manganitolerans TaxID=1884992 RepID=UPI001294F31D|nr:ABC transporter substrate-binding protein [Cumulibacter manganitolerans]
MRTKIAMLLAAVLLMAGCGSDDSSSSGGGKTEPGPTTVKVAHLPSALFAPLYVADAKGYFKDEGLTLELEAIKSGQDGVPLLASGKLDVMVAGFSAGMFNALNSGLKFQIVGSMGISTGDPAKSPTALEVAKSTGITDIKGLKGKKVAAAGGPGATGGYLLAQVLGEAGLSLKDVEVVNLANPDMEAALGNGSVDAALASAPFTTSMESKGVAEPIGVPKKGTTGTGVMYGPDYAKTESAKKFFKALAKGAKDCQGDIASNDEILQILADATGQKLDVLKKTPFYTWHPDLAPQPDQLEAMQKAWMSSGQISYDKPLKVADFVDASFAKANG